jgi:hypothetical protein
MVARMTRSVYTDNVIDRIKKMQRDGSSNSEIAMAIGTTERRLNKRVGQLGLARSKTGRLDLRVTGVVARLFYDAAGVRSITVTRLVKLLLLRIARDNLVSAILDDGK